MVELRIAKAGHDAADYAVKRWHYSRSLPAGKLFIRGVWEDGGFVGVVIFSRGAVHTLGKPFGLEQTECVELTRIALGRHVAPVSRIVAAALRDLKAANPDIRLVISYADPEHGHHGGIYQAGNWVYLGQGTAAPPQFVIHGKRYHHRSIVAKRWRLSLDWLRANVDPHARQITVVPKHKYVMPLDRAMARRVQKLAQPYPAAYPEPVKV